MFFLLKTGADTHFSKAIRDTGAVIQFEEKPFVKLWYIKLGPTLRFDAESANVELL